MYKEAALKYFTELTKEANIGRYLASPSVRNRVLLGALVGGASVGMPSAMQNLVKTKDNKTLTEKRLSQLARSINPTGYASKVSKAQANMLADMAKADREHPVASTLLATALGAGIGGSLGFKRGVNILLGKTASLNPMAVGKRLRLPNAVKSMSTPNRLKLPSVNPRQ